MNTYQVPLLTDVLKEYRFAVFSDEKAVKYDAFLERVLDDADTCLDDADTCIDLYGQKTCYDSYRYLITPKCMDYRIVETYGLMLRPHEENILHKEKGSYFIKYDLSQAQKNRLVNKTETALQYYHYIVYQSATNMMTVKELVHHLFRIIKYRIKKKIRRR